MVSPYSVLQLIINNAVQLYSIYCYRRPQRHLVHNNPWPDLILCSGGQSVLDAGDEVDPHLLLRDNLGLHHSLVKPEELALKGLLTKSII